MARPKQDSNVIEAADGRLFPSKSWIMSHGVAVASLWRSVRPASNGFHYLSGGPGVMFTYALFAVAERSSANSPTHNLVVLPKTQGYDGNGGTRRESINITGMWKSDELTAEFGASVFSAPCVGNSNNYGGSLYLIVPNLDAQGNKPTGTLPTHTLLLVSKPEEMMNVSEDDLGEDDLGGDDLAPAQRRPYIAPTAAPVRSPRAAAPVPRAPRRPQAPAVVEDVEDEFETPAPVRSPRAQAPARAPRAPRQPQQASAYELEI